MDPKITLKELIESLRSIGESLASDEYIKAADERDMGEYLITLADRLEKDGIK